jgi:hypothetical protein
MPRFYAEEEITRLQGVNRRAAAMSSKLRERYPDSYFVFHTRGYGRKFDSKTEAYSFRDSLPYPRNLTAFIAPPRALLPKREKH